MRRRLALRFGQALALLCALAVTVPVAHAETRFTVDLPGPGTAVVLEASVLNGSLLIEPGAEDAIGVVLDTPGETLDVEAELGTWSVPAIGLTVETLENRAVLKTRWTRPLTVRLRVPPRAMLKLQTVMGGDLLLRDMQGAIEIKANNSNVTATGVAGPIIVSSIKGSIEVEFAAVEAASTASLVTWSGDIRVVLAPGLGVDLRLKAVRGEIDSDVPLATSASGNNPRHKAELRGRVGSGGPDFRLESYSGTLIVRQR